jgi:hypothetical protein
MGWLRSLTASQPCFFLCSSRVVAKLDKKMIILMFPDNRSYTFKVSGLILTICLAIFPLSSRLRAVSVELRFCF